MTSTVSGRHFEIGYGLIPQPRNKGYCTEATRVLVDFLFLSKNIVQIQAKTNPRNVASQRVLEKAGFKREGLIRKDVFIRGQWQDGVLYSILREEWKKPKILNRNSRIDPFEKRRKERGGFWLFISGTVSVFAIPSRLRLS